MFTYYLHCVRFCSFFVIILHESYLYTEIDYDYEDETT